MNVKSVIYWIGKAMFTWTFYLCKMCWKLLFIVISYQISFHQIDDELHHKLTRSNPFPSIEASIAAKFRGKKCCKSRHCSNKAISPFTTMFSAQFNNVLYLIENLHCFVEVFFKVVSFRFVLCWKWLTTIQIMWHVCLVILTLTDALNNQEDLD